VIEDNVYKENVVQRMQFSVMIYGDIPRDYRERVR